MSLLEATVRALSVLAAFLVLPLLVGQTEHKVMAHMQGRLGPMYAGGYHGWAQLVADGVKFVQKEDITPRAADRWVFRLAPAVALIPYLVALATIPVAPGVAAIDVPGSLVLVLAATSVGALGTLMAGWASANKYALLGGLRAAAQLVSYELPIVLAMASIALAGSLPVARRRSPTAGRRGGCCRSCRAPVVFLVAGRGEVAAAAVRHAGRRRRASHGCLDRVTGPALRLLPARRVRRHRRDVAALRLAVAGWVARTLRGHPLGWLWTLLKGFPRRRPS